ncbi:hypothetical protein [Frigidibacter sp. ROC022]|uniref:hypothetical protein n=1 Tax=Frigidibacter sp. ROC022 TaxID=2971796 RepID=UPI00215B170F|nr:hypothetical protein [Frigidibacter sp. ROC022]MCR8723706.1 hypothetical protein [Frigidibacter sp. ROC022]
MSGSGEHMDQENMRVFHDRLARVEKRAEQNLQEMRKRRARMRSRKTGLFSNVFAILSGGLAVVASRLFRADFFDAGLTGSGAQEAMINDALLALAVALLVKMLFRLNLRQFLFLQTAGAAAMLLGMHNLVHMAPDIFAEIFPQQWVSAVLVETEPNSLLIRGASLTF